MAAERWQEWQVPPFSHYISEEAQYETAQARAAIAFLIEAIVCPTVEGIGDFLRSREKLQASASM